MIEPGEPLAEFLRVRKDELLQAWRQRVLDDPGVPEANRLPVPAMLDHVPMILDRLIAALGRIGRSAGPEQIGRTTGADAASRAHADERFAEGYTLPAAVRELSHLRAAIIELCGRTGRSMSADEALVLHVDLDEIMMTAADRIHRAAREELRTSHEQRLQALARERLAVDAAERTELELRRLSESGVIGIIVSKGDGRIIDANDTFLRLVGYTRDDLIAGRVRWSEMTPRQYAHLDERALAELERDGVAAPYEKAYLHRDGHPVHIAIGIASLQPSENTYVAYVIDISRRLQVEAALREASRERDASLLTLDTLLAAAPVGFAVVDTELRYVRVNEALARFNGVPVDQHAGRRVCDVLGPPGDGVEALLRRVLSSGEPLLGLRLNVPMQDGERQFQLSYYPLRRADGSLLGVGGVVVDITAETRAERELRQDAELRDRFMAVLGHDLRSPLGAIAMSATLLLHQELPAAHVQLAQRVARSADRMERLIRDLLDLVRGRQGAGLPIQPRPLVLKDVCSHVIDEVNAVHAERTIELVAHGGCQGQFDPDRIAQLASNLITNAVLYSPPDTVVRVDVGGADDRTVFLRVHNQGEPIPSDLLPDLFDPFRRGRHDQRTRAAGNGLGLGLHIAQAIAQAHGGEIAVESAPERGTTFTVLLPRDPRGAAAGADVTARGATAT